MIDMDESSSSHHHHHHHHQQQSAQLVPVMFLEISSAGNLFTSLKWLLIANLMMMMTMVMTMMMDMIADDDDTHFAFLSSIKYSCSLSTRPVGSFPSR